MGPHTKYASFFFFKIFRSFHLLNTSKKVEENFSHLQNAGLSEEHLREYTLHAYIHTYIHTYIRTYIRTYVRTYIHTYVHTYICTCMRMYLHTCIHTYVRTYIQYVVICISTDSVEHMSRFLRTGPPLLSQLYPPYSHRPSLPPSYTPFPPAITPTLLPLAPAHLSLTLTPCAICQCMYLETLCMAAPSVLYQDLENEVKPKLQ